MHASLLLPLALALLIGWRLYARLRRLSGRQKLRPLRAWLTLLGFPLLIALLLANPLVSAAGSAALLGGAGAGIALGGFGLRLTRFEAGADGLFYTPNAHLGIALSALLALRVLARLLQDAFAADPLSHALFPGPLTLLLLATLAGYYGSYAGGLLYRRHAPPSA